MILTLVFVTVYFVVYLFDIVKYSLLGFLVGLWYLLVFNLHDVDYSIIRNYVVMVIIQNKSVSGVDNWRG